MATAMLGLAGTGFIHKTAPTPCTSAAPASAQAGTSPKGTFANSYYWYSAFDGSYNDYETIAYEIWEMEIWYGVTVDQNPAGGTLVEKGYWYENPEYPPMELLYGHF